MPAARHRSRSPSITPAVSATIGTCFCCVARMRRVASKPSSYGIWQSMNTRSNAP